eukprot:TRINITY_DN36930_c0_g1_i1.p1 TRINITY_DN36930_c0_g1~~TRINITY_DN36930_c0_g1_i1.p1  ORF type:complete len:513 (-),score=34.42 TRINITY_DN36930_c0_g1_i1:93-1427(-)
MVRLVIKFETLWMLTQGLLNSANTMVSVLIVLTAILYMFACIGVDLIGKHDHLSNADADELFVETAEIHFSTLPRAMLTTFSFLAFDSVRQLYWPLIMKDPALMLYFLAVVFIVGIVLANLITAVMVNGAFEQASENREAKQIKAARQRKARLQETAEVFKSLDHDCSGLITREKLRLISEDTVARLEYLTEIRSHMELFDVLDLDGSGEVDMAEFLTGIEKVSEAPSLSFEFLKLGMALKQLASTMQVQNQKVLQAFAAIEAEVRKRPDAVRPGPDKSPKSRSDEVCIEFPAPEVSCLGLIAPDEADAAVPAVLLHDVPLPPTPTWASAIHASLLEKLESSTQQILEVLCEGLEDAVVADSSQGKPNHDRQDRENTGTWDPEHLQSERTLAFRPRSLQLTATRQEDENWRRSGKYGGGSARGWRAHAARVPPTRVPRAKPSER